MKRWLGTALAVGIVAIATWFLVGRLRSQWDTVGPALRNAPLWTLAVAFACAAGSMIGLAMAWRVILWVLGASPPRRQMLTWYFAGEIGKYAPGGIWQLLGRSELATRGGVKRPVAYASVAASLLQLIASGALTVSLIAPWALEGYPDWIRFGTVGLAPLVILGLHPRVIDQLRRTMVRLRMGRLAPPPVMWRSTIAIVIAGIPSWILIGLTHLFLAIGLGVSVTPLRIIGASIVAWVLGTVVIIAPAGLGVREVAFISVAGLSPGYGVAVSTAARFCFVLVDGIGAAIAFTALSRTHRGPSAIGADDEVGLHTDAATTDGSVTEPLGSLDDPNPVRR